VEVPESDRRAVAEVPVEQRSSDIAWLVIEFDPGSGGWFLFLHRSLEEACTFDSWYLTRAEALREAESDWGVRPEAWRADAPGEDRSGSPPA